MADEVAVDDERAELKAQALSMEHELPTDDEDMVYPCNIHDEDPTSRLMDTCH